VNMSTRSETSSMLCGIPSPDRSISDQSEFESTDVLQNYSAAATSHDRFSSTDSKSKLEKINEWSSMSDNPGMLLSFNHGDISADVSTEESQANNDTNCDLTITEKMARLRLDNSHHEDSFVTDVVPKLETADATDPDLELAANELSFNISVEIDRIYRRICAEAAKSSTTSTTTETQTSIETNRDTTVATAWQMSGKRDFTSSVSSRSKSNKLSSSTTVSEFAPAVMSTPYYKRDDDSLDGLCEFTFQPWKNETKKSNSDSSGYGGRNSSTLSDDSSTLNDSSKRLPCYEHTEEWSRSSSLIQEEVRLAYANRITHSTIYLEPNSLSIANNSDSNSIRCHSLSTSGTLLSKAKKQQGVEAAERRERSTSTRTVSHLSALSDTGSFYRNVEHDSRNTSYHSISRSTGSAYMKGKPSVDPFVRYMNEKKRTIDAINEISETGETEEIHESAVVTQDSIRTQMGSRLHSCGWLRRRVEHDSRPVSVLTHVTGKHNQVDGILQEDWKELSQNTSFKTTTLHGNSDLARGNSSSLYQSRLLRSLSQSSMSERNRTSSSDNKKFGSANNDDSLIFGRQFLGDHSKISENASITSKSTGKPRSTRRRSKSCRTCVSGRLPTHTNTKLSPKMNDISGGPQFEYSFAIDNNRMHKPYTKLSESEWHNGKYFSEKWERFVSRKLLFDISRNLEELDDADYDIFIPDEILERADPEQLLRNRQAVKRAVRHIHDDPKMAQILLDYSGDINDVSAARRHYSEAIKNNAAFADLTKSFNAALDHFLSFSNDPSDEEYQSLTEEPKTAAVKRQKPRKNRKKTLFL
uniref:Uncharacterized protein n=2 Tax=Parascaris univalens TaxID=6257 RepID=A0A915AQS9_PARUN